MLKYGPASKGFVASGSLCLAVTFCLGACSLLFTPADESQPAVDPPCEGIAQSFPRGQEIEPGYFSHIDYRQGSLTFWVRPLEPVVIDSGLVDLSGIRVSAAAQGGVTVEFDGQDALFAPGPAWAAGEEVFVALRWDSHHPLSGFNTLQPHVEVRVDQREEHFMDGEVGYTAQWGDSPELVIGSSDGAFHVDQLVIYERPLFVNDDINDVSELVLMSNDKRNSPVYASGGFDVLFATVLPVEFSCQTYSPEAWVRAVDLLETDLRIDPVAWGAEDSLAPEAEQVFPGGGIGLDPLIGIVGPTEQTLEVTPNSAYLVEVLAHGQNPTVHVAYFEQKPFALIQGGLSARENPERLLLSFDTNSIEREVTITLSGDAGPVYFHSITVTPNLLSDGGFEVDALSSSAWDDDGPGEAPTLTDDPIYVYAGSKSACLNSQTSPNVLVQAPVSMSDDELYLFGAVFWWNLGAAPGVSIGNGSLFATGVPYSARSKAGRLIEPLEQVWQIAGTAGRRLIDSRHNNHNDLIRFGAPGYNSDESSSNCLDSAYTLALDRLPGAMLPNWSGM